MTTKNLNAMPTINLNFPARDRGRSFDHRPNEREQMSNIDWSHRDEWTANRYSHVCRVMVSRHTKNDEGENGWAVYAIVFPEHPLFPVLLAAHQAKTPYYRIQEVSDMPLHCCCSYFDAVDRAGKVISFKIGADYGHLHDDLYLRRNTADEVPGIFDDARLLLDHLMAKATP